MSNFGGFSDPKVATEEIQKLCDQLRPIVEATTRKKFKVFVAVKYISQVVSGTNYIIKVHVGADAYIHLSVFQALPCHGGKVELGGVQENKTKDDPLTSF